MWQLQLPLKKVTPSFLATPSKSRGPVKPPSFWKFGWRLNPHLQKGGCTLCSDKDIKEIACGISRGWLKRKQNFQGWPRKNNVEFPGVLLLGLAEFPRDLINFFCGISKGRALFHLEIPDSGFSNIFYLWNNPIKDTIQIRHRSDQTSFVLVSLYC